MNLYAFLGIERSATAHDIKKAWRSGVRKHHPDKGGSRERFDEIQLAYEVLSDESERAEYDRTGKVGERRPEGNDMAEAYNYLTSLMGSALTTIRDHRTQSLTREMAKLLARQIDDVKRKQKDAAKALEHVKDIRTRVTAKADADNLMGRLLDAQIANGEQTVANFVPQIKTMETVAKLIDQHEYRVDNVSQPFAEDEVQDDFASPWRY